jgi:hypothetical protein
MSLIASIRAMLRGEVKGWEPPISLLTVCRHSASAKAAASTPVTSTAEIAENSETKAFRMSRG